MSAIQSIFFYFDSIECAYADIFKVKVYIFYVIIEQIYEIQDRNLKKVMFHLDCIWLNFSLLVFIHFCSFILLIFYGL
jgi:hypothetical protein